MSAKHGAANCMSGALQKHLADRIPKAAREAHGRFPLIPAEDFEQEMWLRALASAALYQADLDAGNEAFVWRHLKDSGHRYGMQDDRDRRARKAFAAGYATYDEVFYSPKMVGQILAELVSAAWDLPYAMDRATKGTDLNGTRIQGGDGSHDSFMDYLALLTDIKGAYERLSRHQQDTLATWYGEGSDDEAAKWDHESIAGSMGLSYDALRKRKDRAVSVLIRDLGGKSPYR
jgi:hypothetical protein